MLRVKKSGKGGRFLDTSATLKRAKNNISKQALLAALVVLLTIIILFAITAAWYTNIVQTSGLVLEAEVWGFEGEVNLNTEEAIQASPGEEDVIELTAVNNSENVALVGINVNKAKMPDAIQQRMYFYVDARETINGEEVDRVYLSNSMNFTYVMFSHDVLTLTERVYNDARLKWHWVYDVLGYYVEGVQTPQGVVVSEYLRPIEYDYDEATTTFEKDSEGNLSGKITAIDGMAPIDFLVEFSKTDGYEGVLRRDTASVDGYYPVDVDETGRGVWAYLCTYSEIEMNTIYDTELGRAVAEGEVRPQYEAVITLSAQNGDIEAIPVDTEAALLAALEEADTEPVLIDITGDVSLSEPLLLENREQVMIELNGYNLELAAGTYRDKKAGIQLREGSSLTVHNGRITGSGDGKGIAVCTQGAELTMSGITVDDLECALYVRDDWSTQGADSRIRIVNCSLTTTEEGVYLSGNGPLSTRTTQLVVENSTISSGYIGIMGNGNDTQWGTDIQIIGSNISGYYAGIYQPQRNSTLTVSQLSDDQPTYVSGGCGIVLKSGSATILGGHITGTGEAQVPTNMPLSGFNDTGDGIYIETNYGHDIGLEIYGGSVSAADTVGGALALRVYKEDAKNVSVKVYGGEFNTEIDPEYRVQTESSVPGEYQPEDNGDTDTETEGGISQTGEDASQNGDNGSDDSTNPQEGSEMTA